MKAVGRAYVAAMLKSTIAWLLSWVTWRSFRRSGSTAAAAPPPRRGVGSSTDATMSPQRGAASAIMPHAVEPTLAIEAAAPHSVGATWATMPHSVDSDDTNPPYIPLQCEWRALTLAEERTLAELERIERVWSATIAHTRANGSAAALACEFARYLYEQPQLRGVWISSETVEHLYPQFCRWCRVATPPSYKYFACELAKVMLRKRREDWQDGRRMGTWTGYLIDPTCAYTQALVVRAGGSDLQLPRAEAATNNSGATNIAANR